MRVILSETYLEYMQNIFNMLYNNSNKFGIFDSYILFYTQKNITHNWVANVIPMYTHRKESSFLFFLCLLPWSRNTEWWCTYKKQNMKGYMVPCGSITFLAYILQLYSYLLYTCYFLGDMTGSEEIKIIRACPLHLKT